VEWVTPALAESVSEAGQNSSSRSGAMVVGASAMVKAPISSLGRAATQAVATRDAQAIAQERCIIQG